MSDGGRRYPPPSPMSRMWNTCRSVEKCGQGHEQHTYIRAHALAHARRLLQDGRVSPAKIAWQACEEQRTKKDRKTKIPEYFGSPESCRTKRRGPGPFLRTGQDPVTGSSSRRPPPPPRKCEVRTYVACRIVRNYTVTKFVHGFGFGFF